MEKVYRVTLGGIHVVKSTFNYESAKEHFLIWVEALQKENVAYGSVMLCADHTPVLEYIKK